MIVNLVVIAVLIAVTVLFAWLFTRALRSRRAVVKWVGMLLSALLTLLVGAVTVLTLIGLTKIYLPTKPAVKDLTVSGTPEQIARGEHLAQILCADCHSQTQELPLSGGPDLGEEIPMPIGSFPAYNLTPGGPLKDWSDGEIFRAIRHGVDRDGRKLVMMSSTSAGYLGDEDIISLIAYLRSQEPVGDETRQESLSPLGLILVGVGMVPMMDQPAEVQVPQQSPDAAYGEYVVAFGGCRDCHGPTLSGSAGGLAPAGPSLTGSVPGWTAEQFTQTLRTGKNPEGRTLSNEIMPWKVFGNMNDTELASIYEYIKSVAQ